MDEEVIVVGSRQYVSTDVCCTEPNDVGGGWDVVGYMAGGERVLLSNHRTEEAAETRASRVQAYVMSWMHEAMS